MNRELKNNIIMAIIGAILASGGFLLKDYFEAANKKDQFALKIHKDLYDESALTLKDINKSYSELFDLFNIQFGLTSGELSTKYIAFEASIEKYADFIDELERYGTSGQVEVAKNYREWLYGIYTEINMQYKSAQRVERKAKELLLIENVDSDYFKSVNNALELDIEELVRSENRMYYSVGSHKMLVVDSLQQYLNYQFREAIGISATADMANTINSLPELIKKSNEFKFSKKKMPFMFAENRVFQAATLEFEGDTSFLEEKNKILAHTTKLKFISSVIENDIDLQEILTKRKELEELNSSTLPSK